MQRGTLDALRRKPLDSWSTRERQMPKILEHRSEFGRRRQVESSIPVNEGEPVETRAVGGDAGGLRVFRSRRRGKQSNRRAGGRMIAGGFSTAYRDLVADFERTTGHAVATSKKS